ncbi:CBS domain-containing protein [Intestinibacter sp.]|uniref:CBS domain-containing protein n=1 Tax=Intestinibacter sp. TaxID=1965304 RepID=UPI003F13A8FE
MNILFFLTPKSEVAYIYEDFTIRQTLEKMEYHRYSSIPILTKDGKYVGTITEGDFLWTLKELIQKKEISIDDIENMPVIDIPRRKNNTPVPISANMELLISKAITQNFVPVIDDTETFIGMVKRRTIVEYCYQEMKK